jgi:hypothetical protein
MQKQMHVCASAYLLLLLYCALDKPGPRSVRHRMPQTYKQSVSHLSLTFALWVFDKCRAANARRGLDFFEKSKAHNLMFNKREKECFS